MRSGPRSTALTVVLFVVVQTWAADVLKFEPDRKGLAAVSDPAASGKRCVAIKVDAESGKIVIGAVKKPLAPGLYRLAPRLRLHLPADYDQSRLKLTLSFLVDGKSVAQIPMLWPQFNARQGTYTEFAQQISFTKPAAPVIELSWSVAALPAGEKPRPVKPLQGPSIDETSKKIDAKTQGPDLLGDLVKDLQADIAVPLASITYPAAYYILPSLCALPGKFLQLLLAFPLESQTG